MYSNLCRSRKNLLPCTLHHQGQQSWVAYSQPHQSVQLLLISLHKFLLYFIISKTHFIPNIFLQHYTFFLTLHYRKSLSAFPIVQVLYPSVQFCTLITSKISSSLLIKYYLIKAIFFSCKTFLQFGLVSSCFLFTPPIFFVIMLLQSLSSPTSCELLEK